MRGIVSRQGATGAAAAAVEAIGVRDGGRPVPVVVMIISRLAAVVATAAGVSAVVTADAQEPAAWKTSTHSYKTVDGVEVHLDVHRPADDKARPVVVWIHGGALITGSRAGVPKDLLDLCRADGAALVSIDYRLAPEVKIAAVIEDVQDAFRWIRNQGPRAAGLDPSRLVVTGGSAGGYLTLMTGIAVWPRPTALVAYWGYGDVDGDWYTKPSEFYRKQPLVTREDAYKAVRDRPITAPADADQSRQRGRLYLYFRQNGLWTREVTGFDPATERSKLDPFCPVRNVTTRYPPTILIHGTEDTDVPHQLSVDMARELTRHNVRHELVSVPGSGHGLSGGDRKLIEDARAKARAFIREYLK